MKSNNNRTVEGFKEPIPMKKGDPRVICNGLPIRADFRIISEDNYQRLYSAYKNECVRKAKADTKNSVLHIFSVVARLFRLTKAKCPNCNTGRMWITDAHFTKNNKDLNIYECDRCKRRFV